jgi:hypothetical protein
MVIVNNAMSSILSEGAGATTTMRIHKQTTETAEDEAWFIITTREMLCQ